MPCRHAVQVWGRDESQGVAGRTDEEKLKRRHGRIIYVPKKRASSNRFGDCFC
jgi:hypothetical protein